MQVLARRGPQPVYEPASNVESHIALAGCVSASMEVLCPTLVYQGKAEKAAEAERLDSVRRKRAEDKAAGGGLSTVEWNKQEAAKEREAKLAAKAATESAAAAEEAARVAEGAAKQPKAKGAC